MLHREDLLQLFLTGVGEDLRLQRVDPVVHVGERREEAVDEPVHDVVDEHRLVADRVGALHVAPLQLDERRAVVVPHRDEIVLCAEAMHLDEAVFVA